MNVIEMRVGERGMIDESSREKRCKMNKLREWSAKQKNRGNVACSVPEI